MSFRPVLEGLVTHAPGARGAVFCDHEGEFVDLTIARPPPAGCGELSEYDLRVVGAQLAAAWMTLQTGCGDLGTGPVHELKIHSSAGTLLCRVLREGYYLVLLLAPGSFAGAAEQALQYAADQVLEQF